MKNLSLLLALIALLSFTYWYEEIFKKQPNKFNESKIVFNHEVLSELERFVCLDKILVKKEGEWFSGDKFIEIESIENLFNTRSTLKIIRDIEKVEHS